jgi:O-antigen ligase
MSRASWIAISTGGLFILAIRYSIQIKSYFNLHSKKTIFVGFVSCVLLSTTFTGMYFLKKNSADRRSLMWKIALQAAIEHPLGVGLGNFSGAYGEAQAEYFAECKRTEREEYVAGSPDYGFNEYLQIVVESGLISLILFITIVVLSLRSFIISKKWGVAGSMVSLLVFAFFSYPFSVLPFLIIFVFLLAIGNKVSEKQSTNINLRFRIISVFCFLISFFLHL